MKKIIWIVVVVVVAVGAYVFFAPKPVAEEAMTSGSVTAEGEVVSVNVEGVALDGPALVTLSTADGEKVVAVPSMGINLCAAHESILDVYTLEAGVRVAVRGSLDEEGRIVPCEDTSHYLRVE